ncbi:MAG: ABC transporter permease [Gammaproteobacteria bacterium]|nr:ABC transporter permease [Gammaproteobacteria bacterium]
MNPWLKFKQRKLAYLSYIGFLLIFTLSLMANILANDKPLIIFYQGHWFFPQIELLTEYDFFGTLPILPDYHSPVFIKNILAHGWILNPPIPYSYNSIDFISTEPFPQSPSMSHWLGTDESGHDILAVLLYGIRISILFGLILSFFSTIIGIFIGGACGYFGSLIDLIGQRFLELWSSLPTLYILIILASLIQPNFWSLLIIMTLVSWMGVVGVVRAEFFRVRAQDYVTSARIMKASHWHIATKHILPNAMTSAITLLPFLIASAIVGLSSLDFLGFGLPVDYPSLGKLMLNAKQNLQAPWLSFTAFGSLTLILSLLVFIGEGLRDALDPRYP